uniref:Uncharacterized protein n=1 Tax=Rhizophora mucronata TaxID=61149 RepID=A0A2P2NCE9_RHIMU
MKFNARKPLMQRCLANYQAIYLLPSVSLPLLEALSLMGLRKGQML